MRVAPRELPVQPAALALHPAYRKQVAGAMMFVRPSADRALPKTFAAPLTESARRCCTRHMLHPRRTCVCCADGETARYIPGSAARAPSQHAAAQRGLLRNTHTCVCWTRSFSAYSSPRGLLKNRVLLASRGLLETTHLGLLHTLLFSPLLLCDLHPRPRGRPQLWRTQLGARSRCRGRRGFPLLGR